MNQRRFPDPFLENPKLDGGRPITGYAQNSSFSANKKTPKKDIPCDTGILKKKK